MVPLGNLWRRARRRRDHAAEVHPYVTLLDTAVNTSTASSRPCPRLTSGSGLRVGEEMAAVIIRDR